MAGFYDPSSVCGVLLCEQTAQREAVTGEPETAHGSLSVQRLAQVSPQYGEGWEQMCTIHLNGIYFNASRLLKTLGSYSILNKRFSYITIKMFFFFKLN